MAMRLAGVGRVRGAAAGGRRAAIQARTRARDGPITFLRDLSEIDLPVENGPPRAPRRGIMKVRDGVVPPLAHNKGSFR